MLRGSNDDERHSFTVRPFLAILPPWKVFNTDLSPGQSKLPIAGDVADVKVQLPFEISVTVMVLPADRAELHCLYVAPKSNLFFFVLFSAA
jgi:hypothetical protein